MLFRLNINIDDLQLPILTTLQAKGIIDELNENACGIFTGVGEELVIENEILQQADCVVTIGLKNQEILGVVSKKNFINLDIAYSVEYENTHYCSINQLIEIIESLKPHTNWATLTIQKYKAILTNYIASYEWMPGNIFDSINKIKSNITLVLDTGFFCTVGEHVYLANSSSKRIVCSSNGRNMGLSVPMTLGIAINNNPTICCFGDGGIRYHIGDIRTIIELKLPVCFILFSDGIYGSVASYVGADILNEELTKPAGIDWAPTFTSFNILSKVVENAFDFESILFQWDMKSPIFIEAKFDKNIYREMTKRLRK